jgi:hypothetical protein
MAVLVAKMVKLFLKNTKEWLILGRKDQLRLQLHYISPQLVKLLTTAF